MTRSSFGMTGVQRFKEPLLQPRNEVHGPMYSQFWGSKLSMNWSVAQPSRRVFPELAAGRCQNPQARTPALLNRSGSRL